MHRSKLLRAAAASALVSASLLGALPAQAAKAEMKSTTAAPALLPYDMFTLANGLKVIVHTERKAPLVSIAV